MILSSVSPSACLLLFSLLQLQLGLVHFLGHSRLSFSPTFQLIFCVKPWWVLTQSHQVTRLAPTTTTTTSITTPAPPRAVGTAKSPAWWNSHWAISSHLPPPSPFLPSRRGCPLSVASQRRKTSWSVSSAPCSLPVCTPSLPSTVCWWAAAGAARRA